MPGLTVTEKKHWKNRIAKRIERKIETPEGFRSQPVHPAEPRGTRADAAWPRTGRPLPAPAPWLVSDRATCLDRSGTEAWKSRFLRRSRLDGASWLGYDRVVVVINY